MARTQVGALDPRTAVARALVARMVEWIALLDLPEARLDPRVIEARTLLAAAEDGLCGETADWDGLVDRLARLLASLSRERARQGHDIKALHKEEKA
jgi:hypothetical protein